MPASIIELEKRLWGVADELRANSPLSSWEYSVPVLGLLFLRYADAKFTQAEAELKAKAGKDRPTENGLKLLHPILTDTMTTYRYILKDKTAATCSRTTATPFRTCNSQVVR